MVFLSHLQNHCALFACQHGIARLLNYCVSNTQKPNVKSGRNDCFRHCTHASLASVSCEWLSYCLRGSPNRERISSTRASGSWLDRLWSAERQLLPISGLRTIIGALDRLFIFRLIASQSIRLSSTRMTKSSLGKRSNNSRASGLLCAVRTLNLAVSRSNFRVERACPGSGSATSSVGLVIVNLMNSCCVRLVQGGPISCWSCTVRQSRQTSRGIGVC